MITWFEEAPLLTTRCDQLSAELGSLSKRISGFKLKEFTERDSILINLYRRELPDLSMFEVLDVSLELHLEPDSIAVEVAIELQASSTDCVTQSITMVAIADQSASSQLDPRYNCLMVGWGKRDEQCFIHFEIGPNCQAHSDVGIRRRLFESGLAVLGIQGFFEIFSGGNTSFSIRPSSSVSQIEFVDSDSNGMNPRVARMFIPPDAASFSLRKLSGLGTPLEVMLMIGLDTTCYEIFKARMLNSSKVVSDSLKTFWTVMVMGTFQRSPRDLLKECTSDPARLVRVPLAEFSNQENVIQIDAQGKGGDVSLIACFGGRDRGLLEGARGKLCAR
ncbi:MAG: hypothetical protein HS116_28575 [Planctomycetes bacterium]|nr:hypothetical protein [Planctomycetota bacterium]